MITDSYELGFLDCSLFGVLMALLVNYFFGRLKNLHRAKSILKQVQKVLVNEFAQFGTDGGVHLVRNSADEYFFYCTGRLRIARLKGRILLKPTHDIFATLYRLFIKPVEERILFELEIDPEVKLKKFVLGLLSQREAKSWIDAREDLSMFGKLKKHVKVPQDSYCIYTDCPELMQHMFSEKSILNNVLFGCGVPLKDPGILNSSAEAAQYRPTDCLLKPYLEALIISDQLSRPPAMEADITKAAATLTLCVRVPDSNAGQRAQILPGLTQFAIQLVDWLDSPLGQFKEEQTLKASRDNARKAAEKVWLKDLSDRASGNSAPQSDKDVAQEKLKERKLQAKLEEEARLNQLPADERRKVEERERRKQTKRNAKRAMKSGKLVI